MNQFHTFVCMNLKTENVDLIHKELFFNIVSDSFEPGEDIQPAGLGWCEVNKA